VAAGDVNSDYAGKKEMSESQADKAAFCLPQNYTGVVRLASTSPTKRLFRLPPKQI
jgi:hypothetical protein